MIISSGTHNLMQCNGKLKNMYENKRALFVNPVRDRPTEGTHFAASELIKELI